VLDLTRVIAGRSPPAPSPRTAPDVLRLDAPHLPEIELQAWDMLPGKRSALIDLHDADTRERLLAGADVVVAGYRPGALDRSASRPTP
jgi:crotonobetainyl-CoA:carnitine CoA-transferase CaiB-like acyl-CoA transferase